MTYPNPISSPYAEFKAMVHLSLTKKQFQFLHSVFNNYEWFNDDEAKLYYEVEAQYDALGIVNKCNKLPQ